MAEVDGLLVEHTGRNHLEGDEIPCGPEGLPVIESGDVARGAVVRRGKTVGNCM